VIEPARKASTSLSAVASRSAARKLDSRASAKGVAQGSPAWSTAPERASSRRISLVQSSAPARIQVDSPRERSADSTCTARHCCQTMPAASEATRASRVMASSSAAPRWADGGR